MALAPCRHIHLTLPGLQHRDGQMRRRAKTKQSHALSLLHAGNTKATKANDAGAQQWRCMQIVNRIWKRKDKIAARKRVLRIAARDCVARKCGRVAQILKTALAIS